MDTGDWTLLSLWIHIPIVTAWIGLVMLDVALSVMPGVSPQQRGRTLAWFRPAIIAAIAIILVTGIWQTMKNPFSEVSSYAELSELRRTTTYGSALFVKHGFVLATFVLTVIVHFMLAPRLAALPSAATASTPGGAVAVSSSPTGVERAILWLSVLNLLACLGALVMATRMVWELH